MIKDHDVREAIGLLEHEFRSQENIIENLQYRLETEESKVDHLTAKVTELSTYIKELENALAEAHLTSTDEGLKNG